MWRDLFWNIVDGFCKMCLIIAFCTIVWVSAMPLMTFLCGGSACVLLWYLIIFPIDWGIATTFWF